jgi:hypothetical protein
VPVVVNLDPCKAPEQTEETPTPAPAKKGKAGKVEVSEAPQRLAVELPRPLLQDSKSMLSTAKDTLKSLTASYYLKRQPGREITRMAIKENAEAFLTSMQGHFTALEAECAEHIAIEQKRFRLQVCYLEMITHCCIGGVLLTYISVAFLLVLLPDSS